ncbi:SDR family oxidoreductase [Bacteroidales bacterium OttesenSCG-928-B11]|nr:SDR family oxidoreductase [Bacteroidales bacterium OttesenSCG-928-E04]MDL2311253.1 SDR family oxidoreductase [Bacteroidales bacterium OttesenSCG-928-B11]
MKKRFNDKIVWITGASSGIGEACAYDFAKEGAKLILTALEADILENVKTKCLELGAPDVLPLPFDLSKVDEVEALANQAWAHFGRIDVLYNNAGISQRGNTIDTDMNVINKIMDVNYFTPVILTKTLLPKMIAQGGGQLVVTTSIAGRFGFPLRCAYSSSKHALYGFFETVQAEYYDQNIRVTIVCPGRVQTKISFYALEKDGSQHGKLDKGQAGGVTAEQAGRKIVNAVAKRKREVLVGRKELLMAYIKRFFPGLAAKMARNLNPM